MDTQPAKQTAPPTVKKLRSACDRCHQAKMKCSGGKRCSSCTDSGEDCVYSVQNRAGRPKGARNKKTIEQLNGKRRAAASVSSNLSSDFDDLASHFEHQPAPMLLQPQASVNGSPASYDNMLNDVVSKSESLDDLSIPTDTNELWDFFDQSLHSHADGKQNGMFGDGAASDAFGFFNSISRSSVDGSTSSFDDLQPGFSASHIPTSDGQNAPRSSVASSEHYSPVPMETDNCFSVPQFPMVSSAPPGTPIMVDSGPVCNCLQQHADLLCLLKSLEHRRTASSIDAVLIGIKQALGPWQSLINCPTCQHDNNNGGLLLSVVSMRMIVRRLQCISADSEAGAYAPGCSMSGKQLMSAEKVLIGNYEATSHEQALVTDLLVMRALGQIKSTLGSLKEKLDRLPDRKPISAANHHDSPGSQASRDSHQSYSSEPEADVGYAKQLLLSLESTVYMIGNSLRNRNSAALQECQDSMLTGL